MASVDWKKMTTQTAGAMKRHLGQYERENGNHSNEHINKELSYRNYCIGCDDFSDAFDAMKKRVAEVDKLHPPERKRADRKTACFLEIPCPNELRLQGKSDDFFAKSFEVMQNFFGEKNVHGGFVHKDELHEYRDKDGSLKMSMEHMHLLVSCYAEWQQKDRKTGEMVERKGINGRNFETRPRLNKLNGTMQEMCQSEFGVSFNTGEKPQKKSVERLKTESALREKADALRDKVSVLTEQVKDLQMQADNMVSSFALAPTKTEKNFFGKEKVVEKSEAEMELERQMAAAKIVLSDKASVDQEKAKVEHDQRQIVADKRALFQREESLHQREQQLVQQQEKMKWTAKSQARYEAEKLLVGGGYVRKVNPDQQRLMQSQMHAQTTREQLQQAHDNDFEIER